MDDNVVDALRDSATTYLSKQSHTRRIRKLRETGRSFDRDIWMEFAEMGWSAVLISEAYGGLELGLAEAMVIAEEIGYHLVPEPYISGALQTPRLLQEFSHTPLIQEILGNISTGKAIVGLAWQEELGYSESPPVACVVSRGPDTYLLNGQKSFCAPYGADAWVVIANCPEGLCAVYVPTNASGVNCLPIDCADESQACMLHFDGVEIPDEMMLSVGDSVDRALRIANSTAVLAQAAELLGIAKFALKLTVDHLNTRTQFGKTLGSFQVLRHKTVDMYVQKELASSVLSLALSEACATPNELSAFASRAKARCATAAMAACRFAIQAHGAMGYTDECDIGLYLKRCLVLVSSLGSVSTHQRAYLDHHINRTRIEEAGGTASTFPKEADWNNMDDNEFRLIVRSFFEENYPENLRNIPRRVRWHEIKDWYLTLSRQGWVAPNWPTENGGMGLDPNKFLLFIEEQERYGIARAPDMGIVMIGPLLMRYGTNEQRATFLPRIIAGDHIWCQGYSEPEAGSDLASLRTEAIRDGDDFIINGQKIWTTLAQDATHMFALVRTDKKVKKQQGISFLLVDLATPGITVKPIRDIGGHAEFCEVFFDNVRVPTSALVGNLNEGWSMAKALLGFERLFLGSPKQSRNMLERLTQVAEARGLFALADFRAKYASLLLDVEDLSAAYSVYADYFKRGEPLPPSVSLLKIWSADTYQRIGAALYDAAEEYGGTSLTHDIGKQAIDVPALIYCTLPASIYGGSSEIQKEILAKTVLGIQV